MNSDIDLSYTEFEYEKAIQCRKEIAPFILPEEIITNSPPALVLSSGRLFPRQQEFISRIKSAHTSKAVSSVAQFKEYLKDYLRDIDTEKIVSQVEGYNQNQQTLGAIRSLRKRNIHLLTGGKGGIGKTLVSLSVITSYSLDSAKKILGIDVNTMNTDLFRLLSFQQPSRLDSWRLSVTSANQTLVARPMNPYVLPNGSKGFWKKILDIIKRPQFEEFDLLIDTNLHISNLEPVMHNWH